MKIVVCNSKKYFSILRYFSKIFDYELTVINIDRDKLTESKSPMYDSKV